MQTVYPQISYPDGDSPPESAFTVPEMDVVDYLKIIIPVYRQGQDVYGLFPTSTWVLSSAVALAPYGERYYWCSARYNGVATDKTIAWESVEQFDFPGWVGTSASPFGSCPPPSDVTTLSPIGTVEYGHSIEYSTFNLPGYTFYLSNQLLSGDDVTWVIETRTITTWAILTQRITEVDEIVILIPILAALMLPLSLSLTTSVGNTTQIHDKRRKYRR